MATNSLNGNGAFVAPGSTNIALSSMFKLPTAATPATNGSPAYMVVTAIDRNEYTAGASLATGSFSGNGHSLGFSTPPTSMHDDGRYAGIVFSLDASSGRYYNTTYGYLDSLTYKSSSSANDVTSISLFATNSLLTANSYASNIYAMSQVNASGYMGSATLATQNSGPAPSQATPNSIAQAAMGFVGQTWNDNGCWVLASTIAAKAGAALPVQSTMIGVPGQANGEWIVAYNGPSGQQGTWQNMVTAGEVVVIGNATFGHITTCVSGCGSSAMLVDNITYVDSKGNITNSAHDGQASDITVSAPHAASQEWANVLAKDVVIYELDTPLVTATANGATIKSGTSLANFFSATDPAGRAVTQWQVYDINAADKLAGGTHTTAANAVTVSSLAAVTLSGAGADTLEVRAFNGSYWGDWTAESVTVVANNVAVPTPKAPVLSSQTANQSWAAGQKVAFTLNANTFTDPNGEALTYRASLADGSALPSWLSFNANTETFSGTAPTSALSLSLKITATDTDKLAASELFAANVTAPAPAPKAGPDTVKLASQTANQNWIDGKSYALTLPANTFMDSAGSQIGLAAFQIGGTVNATTFLTFNATTGTIAGQVPAAANGSAQIEVVGYNAAGSAAFDVFNVSFSKTGVSSSLVPAPNSLQAQVSGMVNAISAFSTGRQIQSGKTTPSLSSVGSLQSAASNPGALSIASLLSQFDASGKPVSSGSSLQISALSAGQQLNSLVNLQKSNQGMLALATGK